MLPSEQDLACLHADALLVQQRLELAVGLREAASRAKVKQDQLLTTAAKRDKQADIFGARTIKDRRADDAAAEAAGKAPASSAVHERQLLEACGKNPYQRALLLTQIAAYQPDTTRQIAALKEACTLLQAAQSSEADIFNAQQPPTAVKSSDPPHSRPLQPKVLRRTPNSITLTYWHVHLRGHTPAVRFAAYCKPTGAGVALTINPTAMEYPGSGVQVPLGSQVTIEGLQSNETYTFAVAAYDDEGQLVGELGVQSPPVLMALPLPLYSCWAHILLTAACLRHWTIVKEAASVLMPRFISISPARQLWQAHPMDLLQLQLPEVQAAAGPLLRLLVQAVYVYADHVRHLQHKQVLGHQVAGAAVAAASKSGLAGTAASRVMLLQLSESQVPAQVAMLEASKRLIAAMQVTAASCTSQPSSLQALSLFQRSTCYDPAHTSYWQRWQQLWVQLQVHSTVQSPSGTLTAIIKAAGAACDMRHVFMCCTSTLDTLPYFCRLQPSLAMKCWLRRVPSGLTTF
eukprot:GHRR01026578.1.p1 GENE.GHRR01026578.1~~GHRR01026578.1.p1  ORF type:complete len:516 (+),score=184.34 GHRR01026578.1:750-2297(+)